MNFAVCNELFDGWPLERAWAFAAECGYTGVEISPLTLAPAIADLSPRRRSEIRRQIDAAGLETVGLHWLLAKTEGLFITSGEATVRRNTAEYLAELARLCADLGGRIMVLGSPKQRNLAPGATRHEAFDFAADTLATALPVFEETGVVVAVEPLGPEETNFLLTAAEAVELIARLGSPHVRLQLDCKSMARESVPMTELIARHKALLAHFHANDPNRRGPGFGELDFTPIFRALGEADYRGWVSVEVFDVSPGIEALARGSIRYMEECLARAVAD